MPASFVDQANTGADSFQPSRSVSKPAGVATGDAAAFWLSRWNESASFPAVTPPSGAVLRGTIATGLIQTLCYLIYTGAESSYAFSWGVDRWAALTAHFFTDVDPDLDLSTVPFDSGTGTGTSVGTRSVTTVDGAALSWHVNTGDYGTTTTHTPPTDFTETGDFDAWSSAYRISPGDGSQSAAGATINPSEAWAAGLVALAPVAAPGGMTQAWSRSVTIG